MDEYSDWNEFLKLTEVGDDGSRSIGVIVWGPDTPKDRMRTVEIKGVGFTCVSRRRFRSWSLRAVKGMVYDYLDCRYDMPASGLREDLTLRITWTDMRLPEGERV